MTNRTKTMMTHRLLMAAVGTLAGISFAGLAQALPDTFSNANEISIANGVGVGSGEVSDRHEVFTFEAQAGQTVTLDVNVTAILPGAEYEDDDSQLFLFNSSGQLLAENDDQDDVTFESLISEFEIPETDTYYAVVTTWDNDPEFDDNDEVTGFPDDGSSSIRFDLEITVSE